MPRCRRQVGPTGNAGAVVGFDGADLQRYRRPGTYPCAALRNRSNVRPSDVTGRCLRIANLIAEPVT